MLFALLTLLMPLDILGSTIAGGGKLQTFGNLIFDYSRTRDTQATASLLTVGFLVVTASVLSLVVVTGARKVDFMFRDQGQGSLLLKPLRTVYLNPLFLIYVGSYIAILVVLYFQSAAVGSEYAELRYALRTSISIIAPITVMTGVVAVFIGCWFHLGNFDRHAASGKFIAATLLIPTLLPPVLAGRMAAVIQGLLNQAGGDVAISAWYMFFFGALPILVVIGHPLVFDHALPKIAANHRIDAGDYVYSIVLPALASTIVVGGALFAAISISDAVIVRYIGGSTKTLGLLLADHQAGVLAPGDYVFIGGLGLWTLLALVLSGVVMFWVQRRPAEGNSPRTSLSIGANTSS
jgi:ABC-type spermidine/putrescine transport system permease subunit II